MALVAVLKLCFRSAFGSRHLRRRSLWAPPLCGNEVVCTPPAMPMSALAGGFGRCTLNNGHPNVLVPVSNQGMEIASMGFLKTTRAGVVRKHTTLWKCVQLDFGRKAVTEPISSPPLDHLSPRNYAAFSGSERTDLSQIFQFCENSDLTRISTSEKAKRSPIFQFYENGDPARFYQFDSDSERTALSPIFSQPEMTDLSRMSKILQTGNRCPYRWW